MDQHLRSDPNIVPRNSTPVDTSNVNNLAQTMIETLNRFSDNNVSNAKPDPVPEWDED